MKRMLDGMRAIHTGRGLASNLGSAARGGSAALAKGEPWQKEQFIAPTVHGEITWCQGYSEPGSGSDLASLMTRGELQGDEWVINGQKIWTTNALNADYMFCLVRTEPEASKHAGISYLLIPMKHRPDVG